MRPTLVSITSPFSSYLSPTDIWTFLPRAFIENWQRPLCLPSWPMWTAIRGLEKQYTQPSSHYLYALGPYHSKKIQVTELELNLNLTDVPSNSSNWAGITVRGKKDKSCPWMVSKESQIFKIDLYNPLRLLSWSLPSWWPRGDEPFLVMAAVDD